MCVYPVVPGIGTGIGGGLGTGVAANHNFLLAGMDGTIQGIL